MFIKKIRASSSQKMLLVPKIFEVLLQIIIAGCYTHRFKTSIHS